MAQGSVWVDYKEKTPGKEEVRIFGRFKGGKCTIYPSDMELKTIRAIAFSPSWTPVAGLPLVYGSVGSVGVFDMHRWSGTPRGCYVSVVTLKGTRGQGSQAAGTVKASFWAVGA